MKTRPREFRPYRVAMYALFAVFTFLFIGLVARSVWLDLYGRPAQTSGASLDAPTLTTCADELETIFRQLSDRTVQTTDATPSPNQHIDWDSFSRDIEDRLMNLRSRCSDVPGNDDARVAIREATDRLDVLRQHLARCGAEGERERNLVAQAIENLRETRRVTGH